MIPAGEVTRVGVGFMNVVGDSVYVRLEPGPKVKQRLTGIDGDSWWASRNWRISPEKFDLKTGEPAWLKLGRRTPGHAKPGEMYYPGWGVAGPSHGVVFVPDTLSQVWAWTDDGLYLGHLYNDNVGHATYDPNSVFVELIGTFVYDVDGKTYILTGDHGVSVHEVKFPTMTPIDAGTVKLTAEQVAQAKPWDPDGPATGQTPDVCREEHLRLRQERAKATRTITIDGKLDPSEWNDVPTMPLGARREKHRQRESRFRQGEPVPWL